MTACSSAGASSACVTCDEGERSTPDMKLGATKGQGYEVAYGKYKRQGSLGAQFASFSEVKLGTHGLVL